MSGIANSRRRGRPANPTSDDFQDPIESNRENEYNETTSEMENGGGEDILEPGPGIPSEIADMVSGLGIAGDYRVSLFKIPEGKRKSELQASYQNRVPEVEEFASEFGGGDYILVFTWYIKDSKGAQKNQRRVSISVGPHYNLIAKKRDMEKKRDFQMENSTFPMQGNQENPLDLLIKYQALLPKQTNSMDTVLPLIMGMMQQNSQQMMQVMQANMQMIIQMQQNKRSPIEELKEMMEVSNMIAPKDSKSESISSLLITEGASLLKEYAPVIKEAIAKLNNPFTRRIAKNELLSNPQIKDILADPEKKAGFIEYLYSENPAPEVDNALIHAGIITETERRA